MATQQSVVTPERYEQGISWQDWMSQIDRNEDKFQDNYGEMQVNDADVQAIKGLMSKANGPAKVLALGEPWCTDVVRGLPVMAKLAEATGLDLKIFFRDQHLDIMNEFLYKGEYQSIPVFVFYTQDMQYLGHWIERAKKAREELPVHLSPISAKMRDTELSQEQRDQYMGEYAAFQHGPIWAGWRDAEVTEIRELLEQATK